MSNFQLCQLLNLCRQITFVELTSFFLSEQPYFVEADYDKGPVHLPSVVWPLHQPLSQSSLRPSCFSTCSPPCFFHFHNSPPPFRWPLHFIIALHATFSPNVHIPSSPPLTLPFPQPFLSTYTPIFQPALPASLLPVPSPLTSSSSFSTQDHIKYLWRWNRGRLLKHTHYCQPFC